MATRFLIGKGESLTYEIPAPGGGGPKAFPYTFAEALSYVLPQIRDTVTSFSTLSPECCPNDLVVARMTLHPAFLAKSYFPTKLLHETGLISVGSRTRRVSPKKNVPSKKSKPEYQDTTEIFIAGTRAILNGLAPKVGQFQDSSVEAKDFSKIELFEPMIAQDRIRSNEQGFKSFFEVCLHLIPGVDVIGQFESYANTCGFRINADYYFPVGKLAFLYIEGNENRLTDLANFSLMRVIRPIPKIRSIPTISRNNSTLGSITFPIGDVISTEPKVAILDGGLPNNTPIHKYVNQYHETDQQSKSKAPYLDHGLGVTSAFLFGPLTHGETAPRPYCKVDHHRILDESTANEHPYELSRTLTHIEDILQSGNYHFANLSLGPELPVEDDEVHAWTAVIDKILSNGKTLLTIAAGNNGELDTQTKQNRIQVPSDCVNALTIGASDSITQNWKRANYSAIGPGRSPGKIKPDMIAFGGAFNEYFHHLSSEGNGYQLTPNQGTSFSAPYVLRAAAGIRAHLGDDISILATKALLIHSTNNNGINSSEVGWGNLQNDVSKIITCSDGVARIIYQGYLKPGKYLRAPIPVPTGLSNGKIILKATFCYASPVDPQDSGAYTKAGLDVTFRPNESKTSKKTNSINSATFFSINHYRSEQEERNDLHKWETVLHAEKSFNTTTLKNPSFDIHYNARDAGAATTAEPIAYALVLTIQANEYPDLYAKILQEYTQLKTIETKLSVQTSVNT